MISGELPNSSVESELKTAESDEMGTGVSAQVGANPEAKEEDGIAGEAPSNSDEGELANGESAAATHNEGELPTAESSAAEDQSKSDEEECSDSDDDDGLNDEEREEPLRDSKIHQLLCMIASQDDGCDVHFSYGYLFPTGRLAFAEALSQASGCRALKPVVTRLAVVLAEKLDASTKLLHDRDGSVNIEAVVIAVLLKEIDRAGYARRLRIDALIERFTALCEQSPALKAIATKEGLIKAELTPPPPSPMPAAAMSYLEEMERLLSAMSCKVSRFNTTRIEELAEHELDAETSLVFPQEMFQRAADLLPSICDHSDPVIRKVYLRLLKRYFLYVEDVNAAMEHVHCLSLYQEHRRVEMRLRLFNYYKAKDKLVFNIEVNRAIEQTSDLAPDTVLVANTSKLLRRLAFLLALFPEPTFYRIVEHIFKNPDKVEKFVKVFRKLPSFFRLRIPLQSKFVRTEKDLVVVSTLNRVLKESKVITMERDEDVSFFLDFISTLTRRKLATGLVATSVEVEERELVDATELINDFVVPHLKRGSHLPLMVSLLTRLFTGSFPRVAAHKWAIEWKRDGGGEGEGGSQLAAAVDQSALLGLLAGIYCRETKLAPSLHGLFHAFANKLRACGAHVADFDHIMEDLGIDDWKLHYCIGTSMRMQWGSAHCRPAKLPRHLYNCLLTGHKERFEPSHLDYDEGRDGEIVRADDLAMSLASLVELAMVSADLTTMFRGMMDFSANSGGEGMDALAVIAEAFSQQLVGHHSTATYEAIEQKFVPVGTLLHAVSSPSPMRDPYLKAINDEMRLLGPLRVFGETAKRLIGERDRMKAAFNSNTFHAVQGRDTDDEDDDEYVGRSTSTSNARISSCWGCGQKHKRSECHYTHKICWLCGKEGHKALVCTACPCRKCGIYHNQSRCSARDHKCARCGQRGHVESLCGVAQSGGGICGGCATHGFRDARYHHYRCDCKIMAIERVCHDCSRRGHLAKTPLCEALTELYARHKQRDARDELSAEKERDQTRPATIGDIETLIDSLLKIFCRSLSTYAEEFAKKASQQRDGSGDSPDYTELTMLQPCCNIVRGLIQELINSLEAASLGSRLGELRKLLSQFDAYGLLISATVGPKRISSAQLTQTEPPYETHHHYAAPRMAQPYAALTRPTAFPVPPPPMGQQPVQLVMSHRVVPAGPPVQASALGRGRRPKNSHFDNVVRAHVNRASDNNGSQPTPATTPDGDRAGGRKGKKRNEKEKRSMRNSNASPTREPAASVVQVNSTAELTSQDSKDSTENGHDGADKDGSEVGKGEKENMAISSTTSSPSPPASPSATRQPKSPHHNKKHERGIYDASRRKENPRQALDRKPNFPMVGSNFVEPDANWTRLGASNRAQSMETPQQDDHLDDAGQPPKVQIENPLLVTDHEQKSNDADSTKADEVADSQAESSTQVIAEDNDDSGEALKSPDVVNK